MKKKHNPLKLAGYKLVPGSVGIILDSIWIHEEKQEIIIKSAFGGQWTWKQLPPLTDLIIN
jgi:hypothetical protein